MSDVIIQTYHYSCEPRMIDKTKYLVSKGNVTGTFRGSVNIVAPNFVIESNSVPEFNYVYIEDLNRYYFVRTIVARTFNLYEITCDVDVLMTYRQDILNTSALISRTQFFNTPMVIDAHRPIKSTFTTDVIPIPNNVFTSSTWTYSIVGMGFGTRSTS